MWVQPLGQEDPLEEEMATHSSILAWRIPQAEEPWWATVHEGAKSCTRLSMHARTRAWEPQLLTPAHPRARAPQQEKPLQ